ncbi:MAG: SLC13 family permease [Desulfobacterales bacterium]|nr:SLC13 family permease [Desulfobacterales bacterium]
MTLSYEIYVVLAVLAAAAVLFVINLVRSDIVGILVVLALLLSGVLTVDEALAGFSNPVVMIIVAMFVVSEALVSTGIAQQIGATVLKLGRGDETRLVVLLMVVIAIVGAFMSSTSAMAIFIPVALSVAQRAELNRKRLLMPLSVGALISGMMTLIATAPNLVVSEALQKKGLPALGFFSVTPFGVAALVVGTGFMIAAGRSLLDRQKHIQMGDQGFTVAGLVGSYGLADRSNRFRVMPDSPLVDRSVARIQMRQHFGLHLLAFEKRQGGRPLYLQASAETVFEAGDAIILIGRQEEADRFAAANGLQRLPLLSDRERQALLQEVGVAEIMLAPTSKLIGKSLKDAEFHSRFKATVLSIQRRGTLLTEDLIDQPLDFGDAMLINASWPDIMRLREESRDFVVLTLPQEFHDIVPARQQATWSLVIIGAMVAGMVTGVVPTVAAAMLAAVALALTRCVKLTTIYRSVNWPAVVLIASILPLATALNKSGAAQLISTGLVDTLGPLGPFAMLAVVFMVTALIGLFISNTATAVIIAPIAIDAALAIGVPPQAFAMTVAIACSAAFVTPVSSPVNMLIMEPGGYRFTDFVKVGLPLLLLCMIVTVALAGLIYF